ncbi:hypothetical protein F4677DRAFT_315065 [Hypoxylon crocopeplum]|nr:hypothetical protein F4677DRAFT_315065 [Hypoxylon crocopeplum]
MHFSTAIKFAAMATPIFLQPAAGWSFTMYDGPSCGNSTTSVEVGNEVVGSGDVTCDPVSHADRQKSIVGDIPADSSDCRISFYHSEGCGDRVAFVLTSYFSACLSIADFTKPLAYYKATNCPN